MDLYKITITFKVLEDENLILRVFLADSKLHAINKLLDYCHLMNFTLKRIDQIKIERNKE